MPKAQLKELQLFERNEIRKNEDISAIQTRLEKRRFFDWKIPSVMIAIATIFLLLIITQPQAPNSSQITASTELDIKSLNITQGKFAPTSNFYAGVFRVKDEENVNELEKLLNGAELVHIGKAPTDSFTYRVRLNLVSGETKDLNYYFTEHEEIFYEPSTGDAYVLSTEVATHRLYQLLTKMSNERFWPFWVVLIPFIFLIIAKFDERKMMKETGLNRKLPMDSSKWQTVLRGVFVGILIAMIAIRKIYAMHYVAFLAPAILFFALYVVIEKRGENNGWRIRDTFWKVMLMMSFLSIVFYGFL